ncbi:hypothetical protein TIFTF001_018915 [Ficus carica]|uniref:Thioredoxin domain-containing protein n=1 Tax=Ficus carica TaxID=3494 RepID=A0AA88AC09_FICCA|nr:hypothetical protein TIFTF001_018915 [Ficus carica]
MEGQQQEQQNKAKVIKIDSVESWDFFVSQATNQGCPIVVHFTASWCLPSVVMNPFFEELASSYPDVLFLVVDVDELKVMLEEMLNGGILLVSFFVLGPGCVGSDW